MGDRIRLFRGHGVRLRADIDGSGDVGIGDLAAVADDWLLE